MWPAGVRLVMLRPRAVAVPGLLAAVLVAACSATPAPTPEPIALATQPPPVSSGCDSALGSGRLVADSRSGLAVAAPDGVAMPVMWPSGFSAVLMDGQIVLLGANGQAVAAEGDTVEFGGGMGLNGFFWVCPAEVTVTARAQ